jgi:Tripartite tricarboxylate transporter TctB family
MRVDLRNNKDVLAGLLFILIGAFAVLIAMDYPMGSAKRMGPGYFPMVLGGILCLFGAVLTVRGLLTGEKVSGGWGWKPVALLTFSLVLFGVIVTRLGLIPALAVINARPALSAIATLVLIFMLAACQSISRLSWDLPDGVKTVAVNG